jgi:hypothetical protein
VLAGLWEKLYGRDVFREARLIMFDLREDLVYLGRTEG